MLYYRGSTRAATTRTIRERFGIDVPLRTLSSWIAEYRDITAFARMRDEARAGFLPHRIVRSVRLHHRQVYRYCVHQGKVRAILTGGRKSVVEGKCVSERVDLGGPRYLQKQKTRPYSRQQQT